MQIRRILTVGAVVVGVGISAAACAPSGGNNAGNAAARAESKAQGQDSLNLENNQPVPIYNYSQMRQTLIDIQDLQAQGADTTSFFMTAVGSKPIFQCPSIGQPIASTTQLTNPQKVTTFVVPYQGGGSEALAQEDPTGVYTGDSTGTNVLCVDGGGHKFIAYWEGEVMTVSGPAVWNTSTGSIELNGTPDPLRGQANGRHTTTPDVTPATGVTHKPKK